MFVMIQTVCVVVLCPVPDCIHAFILPDELNELLDSQTELKTTLPKKQTQDAIRFKSLKRCKEFIVRLNPGHTAACSVVLFYVTAVVTGGFQSCLSAQ